MSSSYPEVILPTSGRHVIMPVDIFLYYNSGRGAGGNQYILASNSDNYPIIQTVPNYTIDLTRWKDD